MFHEVPWDPLIGIVRLSHFPRVLQPFSLGSPPRQTVPYHSKRKMAPWRTPAIFVGSSEAA